MTNITVLDSAGATQNLATGSGSGSSGSPFVSPAATTLGGLADSAVTNPASSGSVISLLKGLLTNVPALVIGHGTAAAAQRVELPTDGTGVVGLNAGVNIVGKVGFDQTTPGTTNGVVINSIIAGTSIMGAITTGGAVIAAATVTRPADTNAYAAGDLVDISTTAATCNASPHTIAVARGNDIVSVATRCQVKKSGTSLINASFRVHLYNAATTVSNGDNGAWLSVSANYLGYFDVTCTQAFTDAAIGIGVPGSGSMFTFKPATGTQNLYFLIEARAAYTPISGEVFTVSLEVN